MAYKIPADLPQVVVAWQDWPLVERVRAALHRIDVPVWAKLAAVAITANEQPGKVPVGNTCGLMCQGLTCPWGWREKHWLAVRPVGYALIREGQTGLSAPFLAFAKPEDSLAFLTDRVVARGICDGASYAAQWVGVDAGTKTFTDAVAGYARAHDKVLAVLHDLAAKCCDLPIVT
jgi:hypothetical protein